MEPVPADVRAAALRALARRDRAADLLDLAYDSLLDDERGPGPRRVTFGVPGQAARVEVEAAPGPEGPALRVVCTAPGAELIEVDTDDSAPAVRAEAPGTWTVGSLRHGLVSLVLNVDGLRTRTSWLRF